MKLLNFDNLDKLFFLNILRKKTALGTVKAVIAQLQGWSPCVQQINDRPPSEVPQRQAKPGKRWHLNRGGHHPRQRLRLRRGRLPRRRCGASPRWLQRMWAALGRAEGGSGLPARACSREESSARDTFYHSEQLQNTLHYTPYTLYKMASILFLFPFFQSCFFMVKLAKSDFWHLHCNPCPIPEGAYLGSGEWVAAAWSWSLGCSHKAQRACWVNPRDCYDLERIRSSPSCQTAFLSISFICSSISAQAKISFSLSCGEEKKFAFISVFSEERPSRRDGDSQLTIRDSVPNKNVRSCQQERGRGAR